MTLNNIYNRLKLDQKNIYNAEWSNVLVFDVVIDGEISKWIVEDVSKCGAH